VAFAGVLAGLWSLTLGQDPSNALPHWSPVSGWGLGLGSVALASVLLWIGLVRRKCPDCGSSQMLDAMEEESVMASDRLAAQREAAEAARTEVRSSQNKELEDSLAQREQTLRSTLEQELRPRLVRELGPQIERDLRARLEKELRASLGGEARAASRPFSTPQARVDTAPLSTRSSPSKDRSTK
jgi:predicted  nucleic acid-binding Zn-ribbon protein